MLTVIQMQNRLINDRWCKSLESSMTETETTSAWVPRLRINPQRLLSGCRKRRLNQLTVDPVPLPVPDILTVTSSDYWWWTGVIEATFGRWAPRGNPSARTQLFAADRRTSHGSKKKDPQAPSGSAWGTRKKQLLTNRLVEDRELEAPTAANGAPVLMPALRAAVAQKDRCHLVGQTSGCPEPGEAY